MQGGLTEEQPGTPEIRAMVDSVKPQIEKKLTITLNTYDVVGYKTQVVAGINYYVKIKSDETYFQLRIYKSAPHPEQTLVLTDVRPMNADDDITSR